MLRKQVDAPIVQAAYSTEQKTLLAQINSCLTKSTTKQSVLKPSTGPQSLFSLLLWQLDRELM